MPRITDPPLRAVTFDFWNTLISADDRGVQDRRLAGWLQALTGEGLDLAPDVVRASLVHAREQYELEWHANRVYRADDAVDDALVHLGIEVAPATEAAMVRAMTEPDPAHHPPPTPNVIGALQQLRAAGIRIGIVCDVGLTPGRALRAYLTTHEMLGYFDHWSFSDEVGSYKPDPVIFQHALDGLGGIEPSQAAHVGDLRRTDVAGAQGVGMFAVRYSGLADDPGSEAHGTHLVEGDAVIDDHAQLLEVLGLVGVP